jgi:hypothetical protein
MPKSPTRQRNSYWPESSPFVNEVGGLCACSSMEDDPWTTDPRSASIRLRYFLTVLYESPVSLLILPCEKRRFFIPIRTGAHRSKPSGLPSTLPCLLARCRPAFVLSEILRASCWAK